MELTRCFQGKKEAPEDIAVWKERLGPWMENAQRMVRDVERTAEAARLAKLKIEAEEKAKYEAKEKEAEERAKYKAKEREAKERAAKKRVARERAAKERAAEERAAEERAAEDCDLPKLKGTLLPVERDMITVTGSAWVPKLL
jgi:hypothetical protein